MWKQKQKVSDPYFGVKHKSDFPKLEPKIDLMLTQSIAIEEHFCEPEIFLATLKNWWNLVHQFDPDIELPMKDEERLTAENESNTAFDEQACSNSMECLEYTVGTSWSMACLESLINVYIWKEASGRFSKIAGTSAATTKKNETAGTQKTKSYRLVLRMHFFLLS